KAVASSKRDTENLGGVRACFRKIAGTPNERSANLESLRSGFGLLVTRSRMKALISIRRNGLKKGHRSFLRLGGHSGARLQAGDGARLEISQKLYGLTAATGQ